MKNPNNKKKKIMKKRIACSIVVSSLLISACSGSGSDDTSEPITPPSPVVPPDTGTPPDTTPPTVNPTKSFAGNLQLGDSGEASVYIRNGLYNLNGVNTSEELIADSAQAPTSSIAGTFEPGSFSTTNTQEANVDEADRIEFDGTNIYVADFPVYTYKNQQSAKVRILEKQESQSLLQRASIQLENNASNISGLYLYNPDNSEQSRLAVMSMPDQPITIDILPGSTSLIAPVPVENDFSVNIYDTSISELPNQLAEITIEGYVVNSRRIDNMLYLVSTFVPNLPEIRLSEDSEQAQIEIYNAIQSLSSEELLPEISINGQVQTINDIENCYIPEDAEPEDGFAQTIHVTSIDLTNPQNLQSLCLSARSEFLYASENALYLGGTVDNTTYLHKISLDNSISYQASGAVPGLVGFNSQPNLRLSEWNDTLRIVTTDYSANFDDPEHVLYMLQQQGANLEVLSQLPNEQKPQPLGKPGEDLYAVRYVGDRGYLVTFERIDPLYVVDLSDPNDPSILGELEIPGFSSYLQPFGNGLLLGVGQEFNFLRLPENGTELVTSLPVSEMKISLFDVRDPQNPIEVSTIKRANTYTPVEYDYRALSVLSTDGLTRFAMPTESWNNDSLSLSASYSNSLLVFDVDSSLATPSMQELFEITPETEQTGYVYSGEDRSIITDTGVYYLRGNSLFYRAYDSEELIGPF